MNYLHELRAGRATYEDIDYYIASWHDRALSGQEPKMLHEYLGMTIVEYNKVNNDRNYLAELKYGQKTSIDN